LQHARHKSCGRISKGSVMGSFGLLRHMELLLQHE
jgi:hypothetical protein